MALTPGTSVVEYAVSDGLWVPALVEGSDGGSPEVLSLFVFNGANPGYHLDGVMYDADGDSGTYKYSVESAITGDLSVSGDIDAGGDVSVGDDLDVTDDAAVGGDLAVTGAISGSNVSGSTSGTNTGDITLATVGSTPANAGASLTNQVLTLQPADATHGGVVSTTTQTLAGAKTLANDATLTTGIVNSSVANSGSNFGFKLNTSNAFTGSTNLLALQNNSVDKVEVTNTGIVFAAGYYGFATGTTQGVLFSGNNTILRGHGTSALVALGDDTAVNYGTFSVTGLDMSSTTNGKLTLPAAVCGTATLVGGTKTVSTTAVGASSKIFLTRNTPGGTAGDLSAPVASITPATSFVINSADGADTSTVNWLIID